jgi:hypothetical protein
MLYYKINYYNNRFFIINNNEEYYYLLINITYLNHIYDIELINNTILYLKIKNKNLKLNEDFSIKIIYKNKYCNIGFKTNLDYIKIGNITTFIFDNNFIFNNTCPYFNRDYYINNNNLINKYYINNIEYINLHWLLCGRLNPYFYFKFLLKKYEETIINLPISNIKYNLDNKNTLLFIDDRYDESFLYLLKIFCYSINESWNITVFTVLENVDKFKKDFDKIGVDGKIIILENKFKNKNDYSNLLKNNNFWNKIKEENCLLFQYDSFCMGKFNPIFINYNYIGARWPHQATIHNIEIGNGGTSFRKTRIMEQMCEKNNIFNLKRKNLTEDVFFSELLFENNLLNCTNEIADMFSFENIFNNNSIYGHQIYNSISLDNLDNFIKQKLLNMK